MPNYRHKNKYQSVNDLNTNRFYFRGKKTYLNIMTNIMINIQNDLNTTVKSTVISDQKTLLLRFLKSNRNCFLFDSFSRITIKN